MNTVTFQTAQRVSIIEDGSVIEMDLKGELDERVLLRFSLESLTRFARVATRNLLEARNHRQTKLGHPPGAQALVAGAARASAVPGGSKVAASFLADGMEFHFALDPEKAKEFHSELGRAIVDASDQAKQTRQ